MTQLNIFNIYINKGEIILNDIGEMEYELIYNNFYKNLIKELIFNRYLDYMGDHLNYDKNILKFNNVNDIINKN